MTNNDRIQEINKTLSKAEWSDCIGSDIYREDIAYLLSEVERLQEENKVMKSVLEWYANDRNYKLGIQTVLGERARTALSHLKG